MAYVERRAILPITLACLFLSVHVYAQRAVVVTLSAVNVPLKVIFTSIEKQTDYQFFYNDALLRKSERVSVHVTNMPLREALDLIFKDQPFTYVVVNKTISLQERPDPVKPPENAILPLVKGKVVNEAGLPLVSATVTTLFGGLYSTTNENGEFSLKNVPERDSLTISMVGYAPERLRVQANNKNVPIILKTNVSELSQVEVIVSNGFQKQSTEKGTASSVNINNELLNRRVSTNVLDRLDGIASGVIFNKNIQPGSNQPLISIRGRSTIFANAQPLVILDNFPYTGDPNNINPNDVESITVLKDAAAASIWGAYAANGVIVITTKTGRYNQPIQLSFNSNITVANKPDLYYQPILSSSDMIDIEQYLFGLNFYDEREANRLALSPAVELMVKEREGQLTTDELDAQLDILRQQDRRKDLDKYLYRKSVNQQYAINATGGGQYNHYYFSAGYDRNLLNQVSNQFDRITINANNTYTWLNRKLELNTGILFSSSRTQGDDFSQTIPIYPYLNLTDKGGNASAIPIDYRQTYTDTAGQGKLLDWKFRPLNEIGLSNNKTNQTDYRINLGLKYQVFKDLSANVLYQYNKGLTEQKNLHSVETYYTRDLINQFTQPNGSRAVPLGGILDKTFINYEVHNVRGQLNYQHSWNKKHAVSAIGGAEIRRVDMQTDVTRLYGYDEERQLQVPVDYLNYFPLYQDPSKYQKIPYRDKNQHTRDRFISYYINTTYTFHKRYILSASARKDESNIFGVKTNQKGVPLWSAGMAWEISREPFYREQNWLSYLKLRATYGSNGNVDRSISALTSATIDGVNSWGAPLSSIANPPNPALRWEKVHMLNIGMDFATLHNTISGSLEYYARYASDLIGNSALDPTTGVSNFRGNTANMKGHGIDVSITTQNIRKKNIQWSSTFLFNHAIDKVTEYKVPQNSVGSYLNATLNPIKGKPLYAIYSFRWAGLDAMTGDPMGRLNGTSTKDYGSLINSTNFNELHYHGSQNPTFFGSVRNNISWKQLQLSFNITWKAGYYFRAPSINYNYTFNGLSKGHPDFDRRWQKPGDETKTNVPSMVFVNNNTRDLFYNNAEILVERGDHIRLQDIQLSYDISKQSLRQLPFQRLRVYVYANNIGLLWKANKKGVDPDYVNGIPDPRSIAVGMNIDLK